jgi:hypothetical protein
MFLDRRDASARINLRYRRQEERSCAIRLNFERVLPGLIAFEDLDRLCCTLAACQCRLSHRPRAQSYNAFYLPKTADIIAPESSKRSLRPSDFFSLKAAKRPKQARLSPSVGLHCCFQTVTLDISAHCKPPRTQLADTVGWCGSRTTWPFL